MLSQHWSFPEGDKNSGKYYIICKMVNALQALMIAMWGLCIYCCIVHYSFYTNIGTTSSANSE